MSPAAPQRLSHEALGRILREGPGTGFDRWLVAVTDPVRRAEQVDALDDDGVHALGRVLDDDGAEELLSSIETHAAASLLVRWEPTTAARLLPALNSDLATDILREVPARPRDAILGALSADRAAVLRDLLGRAVDTAAAHMVPEVLSVPARASAEEAIGVARGFGGRGADSQTGAYVYVVDDDRRLVGVVAFRALVLAQPGTRISGVMTSSPLYVDQDGDAEKAARLLLDHRLLALPVVDQRQRLLGILTADAAADIVEDEATDDAERQGASRPLDVPYLRASPLLLWRKRIVWLLVLFVAEAYTGTVLQIFEHELEAVVSLAFFIPLLIGTGGNAGTQITTTIVRAVSLQQIRLRDLGRVLVTELSTAGLIAVAMAGAGLVRAFTLDVGWEIVLVVSLTLAAIVMWSALVASVLPLLLTRTRVDPAVVSGPMIATIVDGTGLVIYFLIAKALLPELRGL
ncbi:magnesium transporter [Leifsonia aquatica]|uniref:magnesium transporter n=1 Tax=Leifsonia aquatica TaxID=144185 RepID=UPI00046A3C9E|nr:magnesium transporter [Leifsonia aquatica]